MTEELSRVGKKWYIEEDKELVNEIELNKSYEEIALNHKRNIGGIKARVLSHIIYPKYKDCEEIDYDYLATTYKLDKDLIERKFTNYKINSSIIANRKSKEESKEDFKNDIRISIKRIEDKLDIIMEFIKNQNLS